MASSLFSTQNTTDVFQKFSQLEKVLRNKNPDQILQKLVSSGMVPQEQSFNKDKNSPASCTANNRQLKCAC